MCNMSLDISKKNLTEIETSEARLECIKRIEEFINSLEMCYPTRFLKKFNGGRSSEGKICIVGRKISSSFISA